jgi:hypothetical protein
MSLEIRSWKRVSTAITMIAILALSAALGCSKQSATADSAESDTAEPEVATRKMTKEIDKMAEESLQSEEKFEGREWAKRYPKSSFGKEEEKLVKTVVERFYEAGAQKVVIDIWQNWRGGISSGPGGRVADRQSSAPKVVCHGPGTEPGVRSNARQRLWPEIFALWFRLTGTSL